jgi:hypothetical protein
MLVNRRIIGIRIQSGRAPLPDGMSHAGKPVFTA